MRLTLTRLPPHLGSPGVGIGHYPRGSWGDVARRFTMIRWAVNWGKIMFRVLLDMVNNPKKQSQGFAVQVSILLVNLIKADLGESVKLHPQKMLTSKSVQIYIKKNLEIKLAGESSKQTEDTASNTEGEEVSELLQRWMLLLYKLYELEVRKLYNEHLINFKLDVPSVNHDYMCIRFLNKELKEIAMQHRAQRVLAGLTIVAPEPSFVGSASDQSQFLALEFSSRIEQEQAAAQESNEQIVQQINENEAVNSREHQAHENEPPVQAEEHQALANEHRAHGEQEHVQQNSLTEQQDQQGSGIDPTLIVDPFVNIVDTVQNPIFNEHDTDYQGPSPSNLRMVAYTDPPESPHDKSKLDEVDKVVASIDSRMIYMESKLTSLDSRTLSTDSKMHSMESKICSINSNIEQPMDTRTSLKLDFGRYKNIFYEKVDKLAANVTTYQTVLETSLIRHLAVQQYQLTTDLDMVKLQLAELVEHLKRIGDAKKGEGGQSRPVEGSSRQGGEGPSDGQSSTRGRGPSPRGGRVPSPGSYRRGEDSERFNEDEVQCLMAGHTEVVFDFSSPEFTLEDLVTALNEMVLEYKKLSQPFKEVKAERESCATNTELVSSKDMQAALSKLETENEKLRSRFEEILCENQRLADIISSWTRSSSSLQKLHETTKPSGDRTGLGYNRDEGSIAETSSSPRMERKKFKTMNFVKSSTEQLAEEKSVKDKIAAQPPI
ncbi:hypothetical protein F511_25870 [Dorcoceras hygrometricum]|uniref:Uncharacterized protein n=1 Tax=Dorcoceras hygrometricum TaxID=472368 RepID=A0A2Z7DC10_9LAMI|nr:hypothetical protein F511_25870 [Dorcoceras hygrometricum]